MSPVSCLVSLPHTERRKKRVRFSDDVLCSAVCALPACDDAADVMGSLTGDAGPAEAWGAEERVWPARPAAPTAAQQPHRAAWSHHKVSALGVRPPLTVLPSVPCQDAVEIMQREGFDQLPVINQPGELLGVVTLRSLMTALIIKRVLPTCPVEQAMDKEFPTLSRDGNLGNLAAILSQSPFVLIVHNQKRLTEKREVATKEVVIGIVTSIDLLSYITGSSLCAK